MHAFYDLIRLFVRGGIRYTYICVYIYNIYVDVSKHSSTKNFDALLPPTNYRFEGSTTVPRFKGTGEQEWIAGGTA